MKNLLYVCLAFVLGACVPSDLTGQTKSQPAQPDPVNTSKSDQTKAPDTEPDRHVSSAVEPCIPKDMRNILDSNVPQSPMVAYKISHNLPIDSGCHPEKKKPSESDNRGNPSITLPCYDGILLFGSVDQTWEVRTLVSYWTSQGYHVESTALDPHDDMTISAGHYTSPIQSYYGVPSGSFEVLIRINTESMKDMQYCEDI